MMTRAEFAREMARLAAAYREDLSEATVEVYFEALGQIRADDFAMAVKVTILESKWFPKVAELSERTVYAAQARWDIEREQERLRQPVAAIPAEVGDPVENRRRVRELIETVKTRMGWGSQPAPQPQNATESHEGGAG